MHKYIPNIQFLGNKSHKTIFAKLHCLDFRHIGILIYLIITVQKGLNGMKICCNKEIATDGNSNPQG